jgi:hypothetical protein
VELIADLSWDGGGKWTALFCRMPAEEPPSIVGRFQHLRARYPDCRSRKPGLARLRSMKVPGVSRQNGGTEAPARGDFDFEACLFVEFEDFDLNQL